MLTWKSVGASKASVLYVYIDNYLKYNKYIKLVKVENLTKIVQINIKIYLSNIFLNHNFELSVHFIFESFRLCIIKLLAAKT